MASLSVPTPDHYLPLLYIAALKDKGDKVEFPVEGFDGGTGKPCWVEVCSEGD